MGLSLVIGSGNSEGFVDYSFPLVIGFGCSEDGGLLFFFWLLVLAFLRNGTWFSLNTCSSEELN